MSSASLSDVEAQREQLLDELDLPSASPEPAFDAIARMVQRLTGWDVGAISLVGMDRQWYVATTGERPQPLRDEPTPCHHTVLADAALEVADARLDPRFASSPLVTGPAGWRAYVGIAVHVDGCAVGSLCSSHSMPARINEATRLALHDLALVASALLQAHLRAQRSKSHVLSRMSHEMRTPLNAIIGFAQLLQMPRTDAAARPVAEYSAHILQSGRQLLALVDTVLERQDEPEGQVSVNPRPSLEPGRTLPETSGSPVAPRLRVLYVEDNSLNVLLLEEALRMHGDIDLRIAEDGPQALALVRDWSPDLFVLDAHLPSMSGYEVLARLREMDRFAHTAAFMCSADAMPDEIERARRAGFAGFWSKPIDLARVIQDVDAVRSLVHP